MNKRSVYLIAIILALVVVMLISTHSNVKEPVVAVNPTSLPANGMVGGTTSEAAANAQKNGAVIPQPVTGMPAPEATTAPATASGAPEIIPSPAPAPDKSTVLPPSEGQ